MKSISHAIALLLVCMSLTSCNKRNQISGTIQSVGFSNGMVVLQLPDRQFLISERATLVDNADMAVGVMNKAVIPEFMKAIQAWKGRSVTCTGEIRNIDGINMPVLHLWGCRGRELGRHRWR